MYRRMLVLSILTSCLFFALAVGAGVWGMRQGLIQGPTGKVRLGQVEVMAFTDVQFSTARAPRGYYIVWLTIARSPQSDALPWRQLLWAGRLVRFEVPPSAALMR
jgi:hypothetical protein